MILYGYVIIIDEIMWLGKWIEEGMANGRSEWDRKKYLLFLV
jgi:hypothetical protein